jgi:hypothetical protein
VAGLFDHLCGLGLGLFYGPGVFLVGVGDLFTGRLVLRELRADSVLLVLHHRADRWHNVFPEQENNDRESDELPDEGRHESYRPCPVVAGTVRVVTSTPSTLLASFDARVSTDT